MQEMMKAMMVSILKFPRMYRSKRFDHREGREAIRWIWRRCSVSAVLFTTDYLSSQTHVCRHDGFDGQRHGRPRWIGRRRRYAGYVRHDEDDGHGRVNYSPEGTMIISYHFLVIVNVGCPCQDILLELTECTNLSFSSSSTCCRSSSAAHSRENA